MDRALMIPVVLAFAMGGCMHAGHAATASATASQPSTAAPMEGGMAGMCPMTVPGTKVSAVDTSTGEAVTFTTTADQAAALREKVHAMADMHNQHHAARRLKAFSAAARSVRSVRSRARP